MNIGSIIVDPPVILAPMSGVTDSPFRALCREAGAALVYTGLISANALHYASEKTIALLSVTSQEHPIAAQLFGAEPTLVAEAAAIAVKYGADSVDLNIGCAVPKVIKARAGAALMADPERAEAVVRAMTAAVEVPVTVKMRSGWRDRGERAPELAQRCERAGAAAITIHPRWAGQQFHGQADWAIITQAKAAVTIPVIGSGDIHSAEDAIRMFTETGCDAVMVGRGALGNPWIFREIAAALRGEALPQRPSLEERIELMTRHLRAAIAYYDEKLGVRIMRGHLSWYIKGLPGARLVREHINRATTVDDLVLAITMLLKHPVGRAYRKVSMIPDVCPPFLLSSGGHTDAISLASDMPALQDNVR